MTPQEIFDKVATHLLTQRKRSMLPNNTDTCAYKRGKLACAVGCLIPPEIYNEKIEGSSVSTLIADTVDSLSSEILNFNKAFKKIIFGKSKSEKLKAAIRYLLDELQIIHDDRAVRHWKKELTSAVNTHNALHPKYVIDPSVLDKF